VDQEKAIEIFAALAQDSRLAIFRLLVEMEPDGLSVSEIAESLNIVPSTLSGHLGVLKRTGLLKSVRKQREIYYSSNLTAVGTLITFLLEDCCNGQVDNCQEILALIPTDKQNPVDAA